MFALFQISHPVFMKIVRYFKIFQKPLNPLELKGHMRISTLKTLENSKVSNDPNPQNSCHNKVRLGAKLRKVSKH